MSELNIAAIETAYTAVQERNEEYTPMHEEYLKAMSTAGAYEPVPEYVGKAGELLTPEVIIQMITTGEVTKTGITNAVSQGKIRKITAKKSDELVAAETALNAAIDEYHRVCSEQIAAVSVKKCRAGKSGSSAAGEVGAGKQADVSAAIHRLDSEATVSFNGRRVFGTLSTGASFDYDVYGQSYLQSIAKMLTQ